MDVQTGWTKCLGPIRKQGVALLDGMLTKLILAAGSAIFSKNGAPTGTIGKFIPIQNRIVSQIFTNFERGKSLLEFAPTGPHSTSQGTLIRDGKITCFAET